METPRPLRHDGRPNLDRWRIPTDDMSMKRRPFARSVAINRPRRRQEPVPVKERNILSGRGIGMPAEQVVVMLTDLTWVVMMADVVKVRLWQRHMQQAEHQQADPHPSDPRLCPKATEAHESSRSKSGCHLIHYRTGKASVKRIAPEDCKVPFLARPSDGVGWP